VDLTTALSAILKAPYSWVKQALILYRPPSFCVKGGTSPKQVVVLVLRLKVADFILMYAI